MIKDDIYMFHQTPIALCEKLIAQVQLDQGDRVLEPFKGEGNFYNSFPNYVEKDWCEITEGRDYKDYEGDIDWVITNPPFSMEEQTPGRRENTFYKLLKYYTKKANKGIAFLGNDKCFSSLTPKRLKELNNEGWFIHNIICCAVKKWRGRYFFIILKKEKCDFYKYIDCNF